MDNLLLPTPQPNTITYLATSKINVDSRVKNIDHVYDEQSHIGHIHYNYPLTRIDMRSFRANESLQAIALPEGVVHIGIQAFAECRNLKYVSLPSTLKVIDQEAFYRTGMTEISFPDGLQMIGCASFYGVKLSHAHVPDSVEAIGKHAFFGTEFLFTQLVDLSYGRTYIEDYPYDLTYGKNQDHFDAKWQNIELDADGFYYADKAKTKLAGIYDKSITTVTIPRTVTVIGEQAFARCRNLKEIKIPLRIVYIGFYAFQGCSSLEKVIIPKGSNLEKIDMRAFAYCKSLKSINLPDGLEKIESGAFYGCSSLKTITLPKNLKSIEPQILAGCTSLKEVNVLSDKIKEVSWSSFRCCTSLEHIELPDSIKDIRPDAFESCKSLKSIRLPQKLQTIGHLAFANCPALEELHVPSSVTYIGAYWIDQSEQVKVFKKESLHPDTVIRRYSWDMDEDEECESIAIDPKTGNIQFQMEGFDEEDEDDTLMDCRMATINEKILLKTCYPHWHSKNPNLYHDIVCADGLLR